MGRKRSASAGLPASTTTSRIKPLWPVTRLSLCPYRTSRAPPAFALGYAHISEPPSLGQEAKFVDADFESYGAGRSRGWVSVPAAEPSNQPGCPGEAALRMRVLLPRCPAAVLGVQRIEGAEFIGRKGNRSRLTAAPVPGLKQLQGEHRGMSGNGDEFKQSLGGLDLAVFEAQSLFLSSRNSCSIIHRARYQSTICQAAAA